mmetsp:Transcript_16560/g.19162  ORF Transcript_16560/g.19162 Transcript_16560/m.19162 type:complete len:171 (-) Transcript_16560:27-539(-)
MSSHVSFPFDSEAVIFDSIHHLYKLVYKSGLELADLEALELDECDKTATFATKEEFDKAVLIKTKEAKHAKVKDAIPWEIKDFDICTQKSIPSILTVTKKFNTQNEVDFETSANNDTKEIAELCDEIFDFLFEPEEAEKSDAGDDSSIQSSDEESELRSKIISFSLSLPM